MDKQNKDEIQDLVNEVLDNRIKPEIYERICSECGGWGWDENGWFGVCKTCNGTGKIDWITEIKKVNKKEN